MRRVLSMGCGFSVPAFAATTTGGMFTTFRRFRHLGMAAILLLSAPARGEAVEAVVIAVADFDYTDTSGEVRDQQAEHAARLAAFVGAVRADLAGSAKFRVVALDCPKAPCSAAQSSPAELIADARRTGAKLLLYGGIQKMSTLIQQMKAQVVDLEADKLVFDRLMSFRGDSDDAWQHAERFLVREILSDTLSR